MNKGSGPGSLRTVKVLNENVSTASLNKNPSPGKLWIRGSSLNKVNGLRLTDSKGKNIKPFRGGIGVRVKVSGSPREGV